MSRRTVLGTVGAAGLAGTLGVLAKPAIVRSADYKRFGRLGAAGRLPRTAGLRGAGVFAKHGVDVEMVDYLANGDDVLTKHIASGKIDVGAGFLLGWLKPLDEGLDVATDLRHPCRLHAAADDPHHWRQAGADLRGKTIAIAVERPGAADFCRHADQARHRSGQGCHLEGVPGQSAGGFGAEGRSRRARAF